MPVFMVDGQMHMFVHVPKCAGTTIEEHLAARFGPLGLLGGPEGWPVSLQHVTWSELSAILPQDWIASSFAIVRHPLDRFVSAYNMRVTQPVPPFPREVTLSDFLDWGERRLPLSPGLLDNHLRPQVDFVGPETRIFKLEDGLDPVIRHLDHQFGARDDLSPLGHHDYRNPEIEGLFDTVSTLPSGVAERVGMLYAADYGEFGYDLLPTRATRLRVLKPRHVRMSRRFWWRRLRRLPLSSR